MADDMGAAKERRILVAVDESEECMNALSWCLKNVLVSSSSSKDTLILLYVKPPRVVYSALDGTGRTTNSRHFTALQLLISLYLSDSLKLCFFVFDSQGICFLLISWKLCRSIVTT